MTDQRAILEPGLREHGASTPPRPDQHAVVGSWRVTISPAQGTPALALATFCADGSLLASPPPVEPSPFAIDGVVFVSAGHGAWVAAGPTAAIFTFVGLGADGQGRPDGTGTVRASITRDPGGQTFSGSYAATMADPAGNTVATEQGTLRATRIVAEAPDMSATDTTMAATRGA